MLIFYECLAVTSTLALPEEHTKHTSTTLGWNCHRCCCTHYQRLASLGLYNAAVDGSITYSVFCCPLLCRLLAACSPCSLSGVRRPAQKRPPLHPGDLPLPHHPHKCTLKSHPCHPRSRLHLHQRSHLLPRHPRSHPQSHWWSRNLSHQSPWSHPRSRPQHLRSHNHPWRSLKVHVLGCPV